MMVMFLLFPQGLALVKCHVRVGVCSSLWFVSVLGFLSLFGKINVMFCLFLLMFVVALSLSLLENKVLSLSQSIFTDFAVPVYLLELIGVVIYFICLYIVYHV